MKLCSKSKHRNAQGQRVAPDGSAWSDPEYWLLVRRKGLREWRELSAFARLAIIEYEISWPNRISVPDLTYRLGLNQNEAADREFVVDVLAEVAASGFGSGAA